MAKVFVGQEYMAATSGKGLKQGSKSSRILSRLAVTATVVITLVSIAMISFCIYFAMCPIIGTSMMTTLNASGDNTDSAITCTIGEPTHSSIVVCKLYLEENTRYHQYYRDAANGDPVAKHAIQELKKTYNKSDEFGNYMLIIKRLIGKPGDQISMCRNGDNYYIYLNGEKLDETYLDPKVSKPDAMNFKQLWYVLNDKSQANTQDWGPVPYDTCISPNIHEAAGEFTKSLYMLTVPADHYFLMGDNRGSADTEYNHSWDSTYFGPLPVSNYVSHCVDVIDKDMSLAEYFIKKLVYYVCFGWLWQK